MFPPETDELSYLNEPEEMLECVTEFLRDASISVVVSIPETHLEAIRPQLEAVIDRDVLVVLLLSQCESVVEPAVEYESVATVARQTDRRIPMYCVVDDLHGLLADPTLFEQDAPDLRACTLRNYDFAYALYGQFIGNHWQLAHEVYRPDPPPLPSSAAAFRELVLDAFLHLRSGNRIDVEVELEEWEEPAVVRGQLVDAKQSLLYPVNSSMPVQSTLVVRTDHGKVTVGGSGAYLEDYEARSGTLSERFR